MLSLGIDTAGPEVAVALVRDGVQLAGGAAPGGRAGAPRLAEVLDRVLENSGRAAERIDVVGVGLGPGPYAALRVGLAAAAGLAQAMKCAATGVESHRALLEAASPGPGRRAIAVLDAGRGEVWTAEGGLELPEVLARERARAGEVLLGPGAERHRAALEALLGEARVVRVDPEAVAVAAARLGALRLAEGRMLPLRPRYPRPPDAVPLRTGR